MLFGNYQFSCMLQDTAVLPEYKGSTFRGIFGHALKKIVCTLKRQDCQGCILRSQCIYAFVFETPSADIRPGASAPTPLRPYVIEPATTTQTHFQKGDLFEFDLLLFGRANDYLPYFIYAFDQIGLGGIGKRVGGKRPSFALQTVSSQGVGIYSKDSGKIHTGDFTEDLRTMLAVPSPPIPAPKLEVRLSTPLRIKYENHLKADLPFHVLIRAALRRISALCSSFGDGEPDLDYRGLVARAHDVKTLASELHWFDWQRYSNRQDQAMLMGGMTGKAAYEGDLSEFLPLLRFCEKTHLGKQTTFGLGRIEVAL